MVQGVLLTNDERKEQMTWIYIIAILAICGTIYAIANQRGRREKAKELADKAEKTDRTEISNELDKKRDANAWDNLNDTLDDLGE